MSSGKCFPLSPTPYSENLYKKGPDAVRTSFIMTAARCLYISVYMTLLGYEIFDALTTSHNVLSVCARTFVEIDHDGTRNVIGMQYATPQPWHYRDFSAYQLIILVFHIHIIISM
jgi:hypothetical protein